MSLGNVLAGARRTRGGAFQGGVSSTTSMSGYFAAHRARSREAHRRVAAPFIPVPGEGSCIRADSHRSLQAQFCLFW